MTRIGTRIGLSLGFALAALVPLSATAEDQAVVAQPDRLKWAAVPPALPKGAQIAVLYGDPTKEGPFVFRAKVPAGYRVPAHMHPADENVTVISGTVNIGMGDKLDPKKGEALKAGGYFHMPKGMHHYAWFSQASVIQFNGIGPFEITYIDPADDPRKTN
jgi:quercetin dioxygenase-like cupin family protein